LAISQSFARLLGGRIDVRSELGRGSTFSVAVDVVLPKGVRWIDERDLDRRIATDGRPLRASERLDGLRVHVVDDTPENLRIIRFLLEEVGATVSCSENGEQGVQAILAAIDEGHSHHVVLMDMLMPVMDGYSATRKLRELGVGVSIVALTAFAMVGDRDKCLAAGCSDYITKPIVPEQLRRVLARYCTSGRTHEDSVPVADCRPLRSTLADVPRFKTLLKEYLAGLQEVSDDLNAAIQAQELDRLQTIAHRLRGTGSSYGYSQITDVAGVCEDALRGGGDWDDIAPHYAELATLLKRCLAD
jgi:CheY-like chemotaxis protein/HPt (histidine-containing phosphotransfer) domain-containing protein